MWSGRRASARSTSMATCGIDLARLARPPARPRSSSTGGRNPPLAPRAPRQGRATKLRAQPNCSGTAPAAPPGRRVQRVGQCHQPLRDAVVNVAGQPTALDLLRLDDLLDEVLVRT